MTNNQTPSVGKSRKLLLRVAVGVGLIAGLLVVSTWLNSRASHALYLQRGTDSAVHHAQILSHDLAMELRMVDNVLQTVALEFAHGGASAAVLQRQLDNQRALLPFAAALRATDAAGWVRYGLPAGEARFSVQDRDYFAQARSQRSLVVSEPLLSRASNVWCIVLAKGLYDSHGLFQGVVYAVLDIDHFRQHFAKQVQGAHGAISLRSPQGALVARYSAIDPQSLSGMGGRVVSQALVQATARNPYSGWYIAPTALDSIERITAYERLDGPFGMTVYVGISTADYLAPWRSEAWRAWGLTLIAMVLVLLGGVALFIRQQREMFEYLHVSQLLKEQNVFVNNDRIGIMKVRNRVIVSANQALAAMVGWDQADLVGQSTRVLYRDDDAYRNTGALYLQVLKTKKKFRAELQLLHRQGQQFWVEANAAQINDTDTVWMFVNVDEHKQKEQAAQHLATHDALTGLPNRRLMFTRLEQALQDCPPERRVAVCFVDLDAFKQINDSHGHDAGDVVLRSVAERLQKAVRPADCVARLGGDEFVVVLAHVAGSDEAVAIMQRCLGSVMAPIDLHSVQVATAVQVGCSIGIALQEDRSESAGSVLQRADEAMYAAKHHGKGGIRLAQQPALE